MKAMPVLAHATPLGHRARHAMAATRTQAAQLADSLHPPQAAIAPSRPFCRCNKPHLDGFCHGTSGISRHLLAALRLAAAVDAAGARRRAHLAAPLHSRLESEDWVQRRCSHGARLENTGAPCLPAPVNRKHQGDAQQAPA